MLEYVKEMRKLIGTRPLLLCGASVILFNQNNQVLMVQRTDNGGWCFPGGAVDLGERTEETARRELLEETGLTVHDLELFDVLSGEELHYTYPHGDEVYVVDIIYMSRSYSGEIQIDPVECKSYGFFDLDKLPEPISPPTVPALQRLLEHMGYRRTASAEEIYNLQADMYDRLISKQPLLGDVIREVRDFRGLDVVDLGAGSGRLSCVIAPEVRSLISTDNSQAMLDVLANKLSIQERNNWTTIVADHRSLPIADASIDLVVSGWSLCYLTNSDEPDWQENLRKIMSEIKRILRPGGTVIIFETMGTGTETPNPPSFMPLYYRELEEEYGFDHRWIRTDYTFASLDEAEELTGFFFGEDMVRKVRDHAWTVVPECAGIWWKHY